MIKKVTVSAECWRQCGEKKLVLAQGFYYNKKEVSRCWYRTLRFRQEIGRAGSAPCRFCRFTTRRGTKILPDVKGERRMEKNAEDIKTIEIKNKAVTLVAKNRLSTRPITPKTSNVVAMLLMFCLLASLKTIIKSVRCFLKYQPRIIRIKLNKNRSICINYITIPSK